MDTMLLPSPLNGLGAFGPGFQNTLSTINTTLQTGNSVINSGQNLVNTIKGGGSGTTAFNPTMPAGFTQQPGAAVPLEKKSNTTTYLLIGGGVILAGTVLFFATRKKKK